MWDRLSNWWHRLLFGRWLVIPPEQREKCRVCRKPVQIAVQGIALEITTPTPVQLHISGVALCEQHGMKLFGQVDRLIEEAWKGTVDAPGPRF